MKTSSQDYGLGSFSFPRGWFAVGAEDEFSTVPRGVRFLGRELVVYRTEDHIPVVLDAFCPHMGSHFVSGQMSVAFSKAPQVQGDTIACPLHGWRFGPDGKCKLIPYSTIKIPPGARVKAYPARDYAGLVLIWHDEEGKEPDYEPAPLPEWSDAGWLRAPVVDLGELSTHQVELIEHHVDKVHIVTVHGADKVADWITHINGHRMSQRSTNYQYIEGEDKPVGLINESDYRGPGIMIMRLGGARPMVIYSASTPVENGTTRFWHLMVMKAAGPLPDASDKAMIDAVAVSMNQAFVEDMDILAKKKPALRPMHIPGDGPFRTIRQWYTQFYNPRGMAGEIQAKVNGQHVTAGEVIAPWAMST